jgi:hypothetical protein
MGRKSMGRKQEKIIGGAQMNLEIEYFISYNKFPIDVPGRIALNQNNSIDVPPNPPDIAPNRFPDGPVDLPGCSNLQRSINILAT